MQKTARAESQKLLSGKLMLLVTAACSHCRSLQSQSRTHCLMQIASQHQLSANNSRSPQQLAMHSRSLWQSSVREARCWSSSWSSYQITPGKHTGGPKVQQQQQLPHLKYHSNLPPQQPLQLTLLPPHQAAQQSGLPLHRYQAPSCRALGLPVQAPAKPR